MEKQIFGQLGELKEDKIQEYRKLHEKPWPKVLETIKECNLHNYSIFICGNKVFAYFEYTGTDYYKDMDKMSEDSVTREWWMRTKPCFIRYAISNDSEFYHDLEQIFYFQ